MTTTRKPSLIGTLYQIAASERQAHRYTEMANALRRLDPTFQDEVVNEEVARFTRLSAEMWEDVADRQELLAEWYTVEQIEGACARA